MRSVLLALLVAFAVPAPGARAEDACARRAGVLQLLFAAANDTETADAARAPVEAALAAASSELAARGCPPVELAVDELWIRAGETRTVPAGARIFAANGAAVLGRLEARGAGGIALVARLGDLVLEGAIDACDLRLEARSGDVRVGSRFSARPSDGAPGGVLVSADAGAIRFAPRSVAEPAPFPPDAVLLSFHALERAEETEITGR